MKIKFKDTLIKENLLTYVMVLCGIGGAVTALFMGPVWDAFIWAFAAAITAFDLILVDTLRLHEKRELKKEVQDKEEYIDELEARVDDLRKQRSDYAEKHEDAMGQLQALDSEYQKLAKQHNAQGEELSELKKKYDTILRGLPSEAPVPTTPPKPKKNPVTTTSKKAKYTKKDVARIREEMKVGGMLKEEE
jgi:FtsZ-binding cell division protein ZapB